MNSIFMKRIKISILILLIGVFSILIFNRFFKNSCTYGTIHISPTLYEAAKNRNYNYCELVECSLNSSKICILKISKINNINNAAGYEHGEIMLQLIDSLGEDYYIDVIGNLSDYEKRNLLGYLSIGLQYDSSKKNIDNVINYLKKR